MLRSVYYGPHEIKPWCPGTGYLDQNAKSLKSYRSREPRPIWQSLQSKSEDLGEYDLHICRYCFLYTARKQDIPAHEKVCRYRKGPPGKLVHEDSKYRYYEVQVPEEDAGRPNGSTNGAVYANGSTSKPSDHQPSGHKPPCAPSSDIQRTPEGTDFNSVKLYLQSLALFGSLFLDTKSICFCVEAFLFYTGVEKSSGMVAGFFSKERHSWHDYNLACIVIFPPWQHAGLGQRFIALSYLLSRLEGRSGSPEKPLSEHGKLAYHRYWLQHFGEFVAGSSKRPTRKFTLDEISRATAIEAADLADALVSAEAFSDDRKTVYFQKVASRLKLKEAPSVPKPKRARKH